MTDRAGSPRWRARFWPPTHRAAQAPAS